MDHEQERTDRIKAETATRRAAANEQVRLFFPSVFMLSTAYLYHQKKAEAELKKQREAEKAARSYDTLFTEEFVEEEGPRKTGRELEEDFM